MIRIAYEPDFLPISADTNGKATGMVVDILGEIFKRSGQAIEFVSLPMAEHVTSLDEGRAEAICFKAITPGFNRGCDFSDPYLTTGAAWFRPTGSSWTPEKEGSKIATPGKGPLAASLKTKFPDLKIVETESYDTSLKAVTDGSADVAALNFQIGSYLTTRGYGDKIELPDKPYDELEAALAVAEGDPQNILEPFNQALAAMKASGSIDKIENRWLET